DATLPDGPARDATTALIFDERNRLIALDPEALRIYRAPRGPHPPRHSGVTRVPLPSGPGGWRPMVPASMAVARDGRLLFLARGAQVLVGDARAPDHWRRLTLPALPRARHLAPERGRDLPIAWRALAVSPAGDRLYLLDQSGDVHALALDGTVARRLA